MSNDTRALLGAGTLFAGIYLVLIACAISSVPALLLGFLVGQTGVWLLALSQ